MPWLWRALRCSWCVESPPEYLIDLFEFTWSLIQWSSAQTSVSPWATHTIWSSHGARLSQYAGRPSQGTRRTLSFAREFEDSLDQEDAGQSWTLGDVARGEHDGGLAGTAAVLAPGTGAAARLGRRQCDTRRKKLMAFLMKIVIEVDLARARAGALINTVTSKSNTVQYGES